MSLHAQTGPFSIEAIKSLPDLSLESSATWEGFRFNNSLEGGLLRLKEVGTNGLPSIIPGIFRLDLQDVPLPDLSTRSSSSSSEAGQDVQEGQDEQNFIDGTPDVWILPDVTQRKSADRLITWDAFLDKTYDDLPTPYISEANPRTFSAVLQLSDHNPPPQGIKPDALIEAAFELAAGRSSALFEWREEEDSFSQRWENIATRGYSATLLQDFLEDLLRVGTHTRRLYNSVDRLDHLPRQLSPSRLACFAASRSALYAIQEHLESLRPNVISLLQLRGAMSRIASLVAVLRELLEAVQGCQTDHALVAVLMQQAAGVSLKHAGMDAVIQAIFSKSLRPLLRKLFADLGLIPDQANDVVGNQSVEEEDEIERRWSSILPVDLCRVITETRQSLRILQSQSPDWSLSCTASSSSSFIFDLETGYTFDEICKLQVQSSAYEAAMRRSFVSRRLSPSTFHPASASLEPEGTEDKGFERASPFHLEAGLFEQHVPIIDFGKADTFHDQVIKYLANPETEVSPFQLDYMEALTLSITPLVSAQHRLLSYSVLKLLFQKQKLLSHLTLQRRFQLLGDGFFSSRLSMALFDSDQSSGEGHRRTGISTGLRLQVRDTWPPASSELRLVLMGILSDSLGNSKEQCLEDTLSFAIRDMPVEDLEKCRDVNSIHALDFLRLEYKPPNEVLETVLSPDMMGKYDRIFQHLLRLSRVHSVTRTLLRENFDGLVHINRSGRLPDHRIIIQMHHFVSTLADYCHNTAIEVYWKRFEGVLHAVEGRINNNDYDQTLQLVMSQDYLRALHERTLDKLLHALLLKRKQSGIRQMLEDVFTLVLRFAAARKPSRDASDSRQATAAGIDESDDDHDDDHETTTRRLGEDFTVKVVQFMDAVRVQGSLKQPLRQRQDGGIPTHLSAELEFELDGEGEGDDDENENGLFSYLLLRLDMFGYWNRHDRPKGGV